MPICQSYDTWKKLKPLTREQLIFFENHKGLVPFTFHKIGRRYFKYSRRKHEDLMQVGYLILGKAIQKWNPAKSAFSTYAVNAIENGMLRYLLRNSKTYVVPYRLKWSQYKELPGEVSKDAWGNKLIGGYEDPGIKYLEEFT